MIDNQLLDKLLAPDYPAAINGFSSSLIIPPEKAVKFYASNRPYLPPEAFNRFEGKERLCRIKDCPKPPKSANWFTCELQHSRLFWIEYDNYFWNTIRRAVFKRDDWTCKLCGNKFPWDYHGLMECDHIIPVHFVALKYPNMPIIERIHRFIFNKENLRSACPTCHRVVTKQFALARRKSNRAVLLGQQQFLESYYK